MFPVIAQNPELPVIFPISYCKNEFAQEEAKKKIDGIFYGTKHYRWPTLHESYFGATGILAIVPAAFYNDEPALRNICHCYAPKPVEFVFESPLMQTSCLRGSMIKLLAKFGIVIVDNNDSESRRTWTYENEMLKKEKAFVENRIATISQHLEQQAQKLRDNETILNQCRQK